MPNNQKDKITAELFEEQINRILGAIPSLYLDENGQAVWYNEILKKNFKGSELVYAVDNIIEALTRGDKETKFLDLGVLLKVLYGVKNIRYQKERQKHIREAEQVRNKDLKEILQGNKELSETGKAHREIIFDFLDKKITKEELEKRSKEIK